MSLSIGFQISVYQPLRRHLVRVSFKTSKLTSTKSTHRTTTIFRRCKTSQRVTCSYDWSRPINTDAELDTKIVNAEAGLDTAISREDYGKCAKYRDELTHLQSKNFVEVLQANLRFYNAINRGNIVDIARAYMQGPHVTCKHPLGELVTGYLNVINSFAELFGDGVPILSVTDVRVQPRGSAAYVTCVENLVTEDERKDIKPSSLPGSEFNQAFVQRFADVRILATNVFEKKNGEWYVVHHSAMPVSLEDMFYTN